MSLHHGSLSYLNSSLAVTLVLLTVPHLFCVSSGGGQCGKGQLIPPLALNEILPQAFAANLAGCYGLSYLINPDKLFHAAS